MQPCLIHTTLQHTAKQAVFPGTKNWMWPETAFSETPDSNQI